MPRAGAVSTAFVDDSFLALMDANQEHAAFVADWRVTGSGSVQIPETSSTVLPLDLTQEEQQHIQIDPKNLWSSKGLPPSEWFFNPNLTLIGKGKVIAAMNTADAHAVVRKLDTASGNTLMHEEPWLFLPDTLEPMVVSSGSKLLLFYRKPTPNWSVFFRAERYSGPDESIALPLILAELDQQGNVLQTRNLSKDLNVGDIFSFVVSANSNRLMLGIVNGSPANPVLRLYFSTDLGSTFRDSGTTPLAAVPYRLSAVAGKVAALVGIAYQQSPGFQIQGLYLSYR